MLLWRSWCARWSEEPEVGVRFLGGAPNYGGCGVVGSHAGL